MTPEEVRISVWLGVVLHCWRNPLEEFHEHVGDAEMARITIATQRAVEPSVGSDTVDWRRIRLTLLDGRRRVLDGQSVASVFGVDWPAARRRVGRALKTPEWMWHDSAERHLLAKAAFVAQSQWGCQRWYGAREWPAIVDRYTDLLGEGTEFRQAMLRAPDELPTAVWQRLVDLRYDVG